MKDGKDQWTQWCPVQAHDLARDVSMHSFTASVLHSKQRGRITDWPYRFGTRAVA
ncbi:hypothetical protein PQR02_32865 [Paraburkholderia sediminicola]|uniref:Uncharacterized protein n=1 Tax=Paraburkholderia rhynchosiae TaxID=487049 RepID=A0ACC7NL85_9BURK